MAPQRGCGVFFLTTLIEALAPLPGSRRSAHYAPGSARGNDRLTSIFGALRRPAPHRRSSAAEGPSCI